MPNRDKPHQIAVTGLGCCCAAGGDVDSAWQAVQAGIVNCREVPKWLFDTNLPFPVFAIARESLTDNRFHLEIPASSNRTVKLALTAVEEALQTAKVDLTRLRQQRVGIALGTTVGCTFDDEGYYIDWKKGKKPALQPVLNYLANNLATRISDILNVQGPTAVITNACASGTDAIGLAKEWLETGLCDVALAGGADELSRIAYYGFSSLLLTSKTPCRPFDNSRSGLNLGEGAGIVFLEMEKSAEKRGAIPHGWIRGYGAASDAYHPTAPHPEGRGLQQAIHQAMLDAGVKREKIAFINCHGTGTMANDLAEMSALDNLGFDSTQCGIVSTKGVTGHTLGAAGAIETIFTLKALRERKTRGTVGCRIPDSKFRVTPCLENDLFPLKGNMGINQSLAFGGGNAALVIEGNTLS